MTADRERYIRAWLTSMQQYVNGDAARDIVREVLGELDEARTALNKIACWDDGPEVTGGFDEPAAARIAREAFKK